MNSFYQKLTEIERTFVEIKNSDTVVLDMKYATDDNFMKQNIYEGFERCFLAPKAAEMFFKACEELKANHPDLQFHVWDALRPRSIQAQFYKFLEGTPFQNYVAAPTPGSLHNYGMALDLTLQKRDGTELDMGTGFDDFRDLAQPILESKFLASGELTKEQHTNRLLLRSLLEKQGFKVLDHEWWHFNALPKDQVHGKYPSLD